MPISDAATGPAAQLAGALQSLHVANGAPSVRALARKIGEVSHTTVADALAGRRVPSWEALQGIVHALDGDEAEFRRLWQAAKAASVAKVNAAPTTDQDFVDRYLRQVISHTDWLDLEGASSGGRAAFEELYIPQRVVAESGEKELDLRAVDDRLHRALLLGDHGVGLSTACRALMRRHAERNSEVPFLVQLGGFAATIPPARSVVGHVEHETETFFQVQPPEGALTRLLSAGRTLIIFDGLAELAATAVKPVVSIIELFCREFPEAHIVVTARSADTQARLDPSRFANYRLVGFNRDQVTEYVRRWFTLSRSLHNKDRQYLARTLLEQSALAPDAVLSPLRVRLACQAYARDGVLPAELALARPSDRSDAHISGGGSRPTAPPLERSSSTSLPRILFVDDEQDWLDLIKRVLPEYLVDSAASYSDALSLLDTGEPYDVALIDLNLLEPGGRDRLGGGILSILRDRYPATRRIAVTGMPPTAMRTLFEDFDLDDVILKGANLSLADFREVVEHSLARGRGDNSRGSPPRDSGLG
jgi:CheY-like chemotaxis protein